MDGGGGAKKNKKVKSSCSPAVFSCKLKLERILTGNKTRKVSEKGSCADVNITRKANIMEPDELSDSISLRYN